MNNYKHQSLLLFSIFLSLTILSLWTAPVFAETDVEFILDVSGSMRKKLGSETQIETARKALLDALNEIPEGQLVAVRVYGHRVEQTDKEKSCQDTELLVPFNTVDRSMVQGKVASLEPKGYTPIANSLLAAKKDLLDVGLTRESDRVIILLTDGEETCGGDPVAVLEKLKREGFNVTVYTVGFNVDDVARNQLKQIAKVSGGKYFDAKDGKQLTKALKQAAQESFVIEKKGVKIYGESIRGGDNYDTAVALPFDKELRLDHHQKKNEYDFFYIDASPSEELEIELHTLEKGINLRREPFTETRHPYIGFELHDSNRTRVTKASVIKGSFGSKNVSLFPEKEGRYYLLIGSDYGGIHKDHATFKVSRISRGDLGGDVDAGKDLGGALPIEAKRYGANFIGATDKSDMFSFDAKQGETYLIGVIPGEEKSPGFRIRLLDEFKEQVAYKSGSSNQGVKVKGISIPEDGKYFLEVSIVQFKTFTPYTLLLRKEKAAPEEG